MSYNAILDMPNAACLPFDVTQQPVLGDDPEQWNAGMLGAEKVLDSYRYQTFAMQGTQAAAAGDPITIAAGSVNLLAYGAAVGNFPGNFATLGGYPAVFNGNVIPYNRSNFYPGGIMCQIGYEFVIVAMSARPKLLFQATGGVITKGRWTEAYQPAAQQLALDNTVFTYQRQLETCQVLGNSLAHYPTNFSSGMPAVSSQNGEPLRGNIMPLCAGLPIGTAAGTPVNGNPNASLTVSWPAMTLLADPFNLPPAQLTAQNPLIIEVEMIFFGYCRDYCPPTNCPPGGNRRGPTQMPPMNKPPSAAAPSIAG